MADFYSRLEQASEVDEGMLSGLKKLMGSGKKLKADELVAVFEREKEQDLP